MKTLAMIVEISLFLTALPVGQLIFARMLKGIVGPNRRRIAFIWFLIVTAGFAASYFDGRYLNDGKSPDLLATFFMPSYFLVALSTGFIVTRTRDVTSN